MLRSARCVLATLVVVGATSALAPRPARAQWSVDVQAGRLQYDAAPDAVTTSVAAGLSRWGSRSSFGLSAGIPFSSEEPVWGALYGYGRLATSGALRLGVDLSADAFGYRVAAPDSARLLPTLSDPDPVAGWGFATEIMPLVAWQTEPLLVELRAGVVGFTSGGTDVEGTDRIAFLSDASARSTAWNGLSGRLVLRWVDVAEGGFPYAGVGLQWTGPLTLWGSVGRWFDAAADGPTWDAGATLPLGAHVAVLLNGRHEPIDPVYATPARTTWGAGIRVLLGDPAIRLPEPVPSSYDDGVATIRLEDELVAGAPSIAGDFNDWTPEPMTLEGADWTYRASIAPGVYNYAFVDEAGNWFVPAETPGRHPDGMGGWVAVLVVEES